MVTGRRKKSKIKRLNQNCYGEKRRTIRYKNFVDIVRCAYPDLMKQQQYLKAQTLLGNAKKDATSYEKTVLDLKARAAKRESTVMSFWKKAVDAPKKKKHEAVKSFGKF